LQVQGKGLLLSILVEAGTGATAPAFTAMFSIEHSPFYIKRLACVYSNGKRRT